MQPQILTPSPRILLARELRPAPKHIAQRGTRPFYLAHNGEVIIQGIMWDLVLRELYDLLRHGRYEPHIRFRILEHAALYATAGYAIDTGVFPTGSNLSITNHGRIQGKGGDGGGGGIYSPFAEIRKNGGPGGAGGHGLLVQHDLTVDNTEGEIFGGGGGGGGGGGASVSGAIQYTTTSGGGGGGGAGTVYGHKGFRTLAYEPDPSAIANGKDGTDGTADTGGDGGAGGYNVDDSGPSAVSGDGGDAGDPGEAGQAGADGWIDTSQTSGNTTPGGAGGAAGNAIVQSGGTVTITAGNNSTQIKGSIV